MKNGGGSQRKIKIHYKTKDGDHEARGNLKQWRPVFLTRVKWLTNVPHHLPTIAKGRQKSTASQ